MGTGWLPPLWLELQVETSLSPSTHLENSILCLALAQLELVTKLQGPFLEIHSVCQPLVFQRDPSLPGPGSSYHLWGRERRGVAGWIKMGP